MTLNNCKKLAGRLSTKHFQQGNTEENMVKYLEESFSIEKLTAELNDPNAECYFATLDNQVIGYLKINFGTIANGIER
jgi:hypothetical protein